jgi:programmed cell death 8 (apoptosis-inducing factor)
MPLDANVDPIVTEAIVTEAGSAVEVDPVTDEVIPLVEETPVKKVFPEVPPEVEYLIVGGGTAAYSAVRAIRKYDPTAKILIVSDEPEMPYNRTPLSKELWFETEENAALGKYKGWDDKERVIFHEKLENYCTGRDLQEREGYGGTALLLGAKVDRLDADRKKAVLYNGTEIGYGKVLLSIGGKPKNLPEFKNVSEKVTLFRDLKDFRQLSEISHKGGDVVVVGSGFLGTELSYALAERAKKVENLNVSQICREQGVLGAVLPEHLSSKSTND